MTFIQKKYSFLMMKIIINDGDECLVLHMFMSVQRINYQDLAAYKLELRQVGNDTNVTLRNSEQGLCIWNIIALN